MSNHEKPSKVSDHSVHILNTVNCPAMHCNDAPSLCTNTHFMAIFDKKYFTHMICNCKVNV